MLDGMLGWAIFLVASIKAMFLAASKDFLKKTPVNLAFKLPSSVVWEMQLFQLIGRPNDIYCS